VNDYKRILKTGALAVAATVAFGVFAYRAAEWSKGINSEMIVLGQERIQAAERAPVRRPRQEQPRFKNTKVIPQMALGSFDGGLTKYSTVVQIVNTSGRRKALQPISTNRMARL